MIEGCRAFPGQAPAGSDRQRVPGPKQQADDLCGRMRGPAGASWGRCQRRGAYVRLPPERAHPGAVSWPWGGLAGRRRRRPLTPRDEPWAASALARPWPAENSQFPGWLWSACRIGPSAQSPEAPGCLWLWTQPDDGQSRADMLPSGRERHVERGCPGSGPRPPKDGRSPQAANGVPDE